MLRNPNPIEAAKYAVAAGLARNLPLHGGCYAHCASKITSAKRCDHGTGNIPINTLLSYLTMLRKYLRLIIKWGLTSGKR